MDVPKQQNGIFTAFISSRMFRSPKSAAFKLPLIGFSFGLGWYRGRWPASGKAYMSRFSVSKAISAKLNGFRRWAFALPASLFLILILIGSGLAQQLSDTIGSVAQDVIREVSRYFADTPTLDAHLNGIGFQPNGQDANWRRMPAVRKIETAYLAAQTLSQRDADRLLARLAKETITAYEPARFVPAIAELSTHDTPEPLRFAVLAKPLVLLSGAHRHSPKRRFWRFPDTPTVVR
jgi:hypothetical protein